MTTDHKQTAKTILAQLGGNRFTSMTGARDFLALNPTHEHRGGLQFGLPRGLARNRTNKVQIFLNASDTYSIKALKVNIRNATFDVVAEAEGIYADALEATFSELTGLATRL